MGDGRATPSEFPPNKNVSLTEIHRDHGRVFTTEYPPNTIVSLTDFAPKWEKTNCSNEPIFDDFPIS
jgi:hypothetical protein